MTTINQKTELTAKLILKNKFWIVEQNGHKVGTIQATPTGLVLVCGDRRESFVNLTSLKSKYGINVSRALAQKIKTLPMDSIYGYPITGPAYNVMYDLKKKIPFYTRRPRSKSYYCAGYYTIFINQEWKDFFCPKSIIIERYPHFGPYGSKDQVLEKIKEITAK